MPLHMQGKSRLARTKYQKALKLLGGGLDLETEEEFSAASSTRAACMLNIGRCAEHEREWGEALTWCNKAIRCGTSCQRAACHQSPRHSNEGRR
jgi:hypothetical protein